MSVLTIGVTSASDCRYMLHAGSWGCKAVFLTLLAVAAFWVPNSVFDHWWPAIVQTGSMAFAGIQALLLVRMAHALAFRLGAAVDAGSMGAKVAMVCIAAPTTVATIVGAIYLFRFHEGGACIEKGGPPQWIVAIVNLVLLCAAGALSVTECVRKHVSYAGILQVSIIGLQMTNLAWLSLRVDSCDPSSATIAWTVVGFLLLGATLWYACVRMRTQAGFMLLQDDKTEGAWTDTNLDLDAADLGYSPAFFHLVLALSAMHITTLLADLVPSAGLTTRETAYANWTQAASSWLTWIVYAYSLAAPLCTE
jgi:uncharacterized membrane protein